jgi:integrase
MKHVQAVKTPAGETYYYHRPTKTRLPEDPQSAEFARRLLELNDQLERKKKLLPQGTVADLIVQYKKSPRFTDRAAKTRKDYARYLDWLSDKLGELEVKDIDAEFCTDLHEGLAKKPRRADYTLQVLSIILAFAVKRPSRYGLMVNPALRMGRLSRPEGYEPWPEEFLAAKTKEAYQELREVLLGAIHTGQRGQDVIRMTWPDYDGTGIKVRQEKTRAKLWIPCHPALKKMLDGMKREDLVIFKTKTGRPWKEDHLRHEVNDLTAGAYSLHGLRKLATVRLFEAGCTPQQVQAITGHKTLQQLEHYAKGVQQKIMATAAIERIATEKCKTKCKTKNRPKGRSSQRVDS